MAEHAEQEVSRLVHLRAEMPNGLGHRLIDRLVEANDILQGAERPVGMRPSTWRGHWRAAPGTRKLAA